MCNINMLQEIWFSDSCVGIMHVKMAYELYDFRCTGCKNADNKKVDRHAVIMQYHPFRKLKIKYILTMCTYYLFLIYFENLWNIRGGR